jgi:hypothetical protein
MANDLTDAQIALLCDIGEHDLPTLTGDQRRDLEWLLSSGYVQPTGAEPGSAFKLTSKGFAFLDERGVGLNEG